MKWGEKRILFTQNQKSKCSSTNIIRRKHLVSRCNFETVKRYHMRCDISFQLISLFWILLLLKSVQEIIKHEFEWTSKKTSRKMRQAIYWIYFDLDQRQQVTFITNAASLRIFEIISCLLMSWTHQHHPLYIFHWNQFIQGNSLSNHSVEYNWNRIWFDPIRLTCKYRWLLSSLSVYLFNLVCSRKKNIQEIACLLKNVITTRLKMSHFYSFSSSLSRSGVASMPFRTSLQWNDKVVGGWIWK